MDLRTGLSLGTLLAIEVCVPIVRSELLAAGLDPGRVREAIDGALAGRTGWEEAAAAVEPLLAPRPSPAGRLLVDELRQHTDGRSMARLRDAVGGTLADATEDPVPPGVEPAGAKAIRRLDDTIALAASGGEPSGLRVQGALVGASIETIVFNGQALAAGGPVAAALDLDAAARWLPWIDRLDARERKPRGPEVRASLELAWAALLGDGGQPDRARLDRRLQAQFVDTHRYPDDDWVAWLASRAVDAAYAAVGAALGRRRPPTALSEARSASVDLAAIGRGLPPWDLAATLATETDRPVVEELTAQLASLRLVIADAGALRPRGTA